MKVESNPTIEFILRDLYENPYWLRSEQNYCINALRRATKILNYQVVELDAAHIEVKLRCELPENTTLIDFSDKISTLLGTRPSVYSAKVF